MGVAVAFARPRLEIAARKGLARSPGLGRRLKPGEHVLGQQPVGGDLAADDGQCVARLMHVKPPVAACLARVLRSEEHTSELQSLMRISYAVFCLKKKKQNKLSK